MQTLTVATEHVEGTLKAGTRECFALTRIHELQRGSKVLLPFLLGLTFYASPSERWNTE